MEGEGEGKRKEEKRKEKNQGTVYMGMASPNFI